MTFIPAEDIRSIQTNILNHERDFAGWLGNYIVHEAIGHPDKHSVQVTLPDFVRWILDNSDELQAQGYNLMVYKTFDDINQKVEVSWE